MYLTENSKEYQNFCIKNMDSSELSVDQTTAEDLSSERSSSESNSSNNAERFATLLQTYKSPEGLTITKSREEDESARYAVHQVDDNMPIALDCKNKEFTLHRNDAYESSSVDEPSLSDGSPFRNSNIKDQSQKEAMYSFCRELREIKQKNLHKTLERTIGNNNTKELDIIKTYGLQPIDHQRAKDFSSLSRLGSIALDRLRAAPLHGENPPSSLEPEDLKNLQHLQSRNSLPNQVDAALTFERLRHVHPLFQNSSTVMNDSPQTTAFHHPHHAHLHPQHHHAAITPLTTQIQHANNQHQQIHHHQQHHHQQTKSFTIDAILGLRGNGNAQRDKQRHHPYRKQGQEGTAKNMTSGSCSNNNNSANNANQAGGKLKRVRTIFTAEQLERLEGEFARQQYMVGPERLYLAHALRLTEAQVKVWFQNRRIKWRKVNHEQQSQRLHELHQTTGGIVERDDSNDNSTEW